MLQPFLGGYSLFDTSIVSFLKLLISGKQLQLMGCTGNGEQN